MLKGYRFKYANIKDIRRRMSVVALAPSEAEANEEFDRFIEILGGDRYRYCEPKRTEVHTDEREFYLFREKAI